MKTARIFNGSWFLCAVAVAIVVGEVLARALSDHFGFRNNPLVVGFLCAGLVAVIASVIYDGADAK